MQLRRRGARAKRQHPEDEEHRAAVAHKGQPEEETAPSPETSGGCVSVRGRQPLTPAAALTMAIIATARPRREDHAVSGAQTRVAGRARDQQRDAASAASHGWHAGGAPSGALPEPGLRTAASARLPCCSSLGPHSFRCRLRCLSPTAGPPPRRLTAKTMQLSTRGTIRVPAHPGWGVSAPDWPATCINGAHGPASRSR